MVRGLPEGQNENVLNKINGFIIDGLKLKNVAVIEAERKKSYSRDRPGLIVAKCRSADDKELIMKTKRKLADSRNYKNVSINHDKSRDQRLLESNLKAIVDVVGRDKLALKGSREMTTDRVRNQQSREYVQPDYTRNSYRKHSEERGTRHANATRTQENIPLHMGPGSRSEHSLSGNRFQVLSDTESVGYVDKRDINPADRRSHGSQSGSFANGRSRHY